MAFENSTRLAVILHADVAGSTALARRDARVAHQRIRAVYRDLSNQINRYDGVTLEVRGDALVAEFDRVSDAVIAALAFQSSNVRRNQAIADSICPEVRIGISLGEVVIADRTVTGAGVVLAQRLEQLARPGGLCISAAAHEALPESIPLTQEDLGEHDVKGFIERQRVFSVELLSGEPVPPPQSRIGRRTRRTALLSAAYAAVVLAAGTLGWYLYTDDGPISEQTSIAVLPFDNLSGDSSLDYLSNGISEDIITALAHFYSPFLLVMSRTSSFAYKGRSVTAQTIGDELGVRYLLEGSVQRGANSVRITAQLIDARTGHHVWAERFDEASEDVLAIQDSVTRKVAQTLGEYDQGLLRKASTESAWAKDTVALAEYDYMLRGHDYMHRWTAEGTARSLEIFEQGLEAFPGSALLRTKVAWGLYFQVFLFASSNDPERDTQRAIALAEEAVSSNRAPLVARYAGHWVLSWLYTNTARVNRGLDNIKKAVALVPGNGQVRFSLGGIQIHAGLVEEGLKNLELAKRTEPGFPFYLLFKSRGLRHQGKYQDAIEALESFPVEAYYKYTELASCYLRRARMEDAKAALTKAVDIYSGLTVSAVQRESPYLDREFLESYLGDLRRLGLPE